MKNSIYLIISFLICFSASVLPQTSEWINFTNSNCVYDLAGAGNSLWIATDGGLVRLNKSNDSLSFFNKANSGLPDNKIRSLAIDTSGRLWIGTTSGGLVLYDGNTWKVFTPENSGLPDYSVSKIVCTGNELLLGSGRYVTRFNMNDKWISYPTGSILSAYIGIHDINTDKKGSIWIGASWGLGKLNDDGITERYGNITREINSIAADSNNILWMGTSRNGIFRYDGVNQTGFDTLNSRIPHNVVFDMLFDKKGNLWIATAGGIAVYDGKDFLVYNSKNSPLPDDLVLSVLKDDQDVLWIGTASKGLVRFDSREWKQYNTGSSKLPGNYINLLACDEKDNIWLSCYGTPPGMTRFSADRWELFTPKDTDYFNLNFEIIYHSDSLNIWKKDGVIIDSRSGIYNTGSKHQSSKAKIDNAGNLWMIWPNGRLYKYDGRNWTVYDKNSTGLTNVDFAYMAIDARGNLWISTMTKVEFIDGFYVETEGGQLVKYDGTDWRSVYTCPYYSEWIAAIEIDRSGNIWTGALYRERIGREYGGGLSMFDGEKWTNYKITNSDLPGNSVASLCLDDSENLWIGTYGTGLAKFDRKTLWTIFNTGNSSLPGNEIEHIVIDSKGNKWLAVQFKGLTVYREGGVILTRAEDKKDLKEPESFILYQNYPNPFNPATSITYHIAEGQNVRIRIYDILGNEISQLVNEYKPAGLHTIPFDAVHLASGIYFCSMQAGKFNHTIKLVLTK